MTHPEDVTESVQQRERVLAYAEGRRHGLQQAAEMADEAASYCSSDDAKWVRALAAALRKLAEGK